MVGCQNCSIRTINRKFTHANNIFLRSTRAQQLTQTDKQQHQQRNCTFFRAFGYWINDANKSFFISHLFFVFFFTFSLLSTSGSSHHSLLSSLSLSLALPYWIISALCNGRLLRFVCFVRSWFFFLEKKWFRQFIFDAKSIEERTRVFRWFIEMKKGKKKSSKI